MIDFRHRILLSANGDTDFEPLLGENEVAQITGRSVASLRRDRLLRQGCKFLKVGSLVRYRPSDLRDYLAACKVGN